MIYYHQYKLFEKGNCHRGIINYHRARYTTPKICCCPFCVIQRGKRGSFTCYFSLVTTSKQKKSNILIPPRYIRDSRKLQHFYFTLISAKSIDAMPQKVLKLYFWAKNLGLSTTSYGPLTLC